MTVRRIESIAPERWRNGGGMTRVVAANGDDWRVSIAEVERDGPYSRFDGITRFSLVLRGDGVVLCDGSEAVTLAPFEAVQYHRGAAWQATLIGGPVIALNVMTRIGVYRAHVQAIADPVVIESGCVAIALALDGACRCHDVPIGAGQIGVIENPRRPLRVEATHGTSFLVTIERT